MDGVPLFWMKSTHQSRTHTLEIVSAVFNGVIASFDVFLCGITCGFEHDITISSRFKIRSVRKVLSNPTFER